MRNSAALQAMMVAIKGPVIEPLSEAEHLGQAKRDLTLNGEILSSQFGQAMAKDGS